MPACRRGQVENKVLLVFAMVSFSGFAVAEMVGSQIANSESLLADAITMLLDGLTYAVNLWADWAKTGKTEREKLWIDVVAPTVSVLSLLSVTIYVMWDAVATIQNPGDTDEAGGSSPARSSEASHT